MYHHSIERPSPLQPRGHRYVAVACPRPEHLPRCVGGALLIKDNGSDDGRDGATQRGRERGGSGKGGKNFCDYRVLSLTNTVTLSFFTHHGQ